MLDACLAGGHTPELKNANWRFNFEHSPWLSRKGSQNEWMCIARKGFVVVKIPTGPLDPPKSVHWLVAAVFWSNGCAGWENSTGVWWDIDSLSGFEKRGGCMCLIHLLRPQIGPCTELFRLEFCLRQCKSLKTAQSKGLQREFSCFPERSDRIVLILSAAAKNCPVLGFPSFRRLDNLFFLPRQY